MSEALEKEEPQAKRLKVDDEEEQEEEEEETTTPTTLRNEEGNAYFELSPKRRCIIREWKKAILVDIREVSRFGGMYLCLCLCT